MNKLIQFTAALMAVLSLTSCATEVGTGVVTSETPPGVVTSEPLPGVTTEHSNDPETDRKSTRLNSSHSSQSRMPSSA